MISSLVNIHNDQRWILTEEAQLPQRERERAHLTSVYRTVQMEFRYAEPFRRESRVWQTNRQTDKRADGQTKACADKAISIKSRA